MLGVSQPVVMLAAIVLSGSPAVIGVDAAGVLDRQTAVWSCLDAADGWGVGCGSELVGSIAQMDGGGGGMAEVCEVGVEETRLRLAAGGGAVAVLDDCRFSPDD